MKPTHIMLDLETWGKRAGCDIRSIGATVFDPSQGVSTSDNIQPHDGATSGTFYIATSNPALWPQLENEAHCERKYDLWRDPETVKWWSDQSPEAQAAFAHPVDLREGLIRFADWLHQIAGREAYSPCKEYVPVQRVVVYAHGPQFDGSILEAAYHACQLPVPWHYRAPRDTRTVFDIAGIEDHSGFMAMFSTGTVHHALDDAICQARAVCAAFKVIRS